MATETLVSRYLNNRAMFTILHYYIVRLELITFCFTNSRAVMVCQYLCSDTVFESSCNSRVGYFVAQSTDGAIVYTNV